MKAKNSWAWLTWTVIVNAKFPAFQGSLDFCSGFLGFPWVSLSCFSMKARNFHTWHSHSCLSWLFLGLVCMDKIHAFRESPEPSPGFPGFSWKNIPVFPRKPGISMLSWLFQAFQRQKKQGKAKKARVSRLFRGFRAFLGFFWQGCLQWKICFSLRMWKSTRVNKVHYALPGCRHCMGFCG